jgi:hypothetical protein
MGVQIPWQCLEVAPWKNEKSQSQPRSKNQPNYVIIFPEVIKLIMLLKISLLLILMALDNNPELYCYIHLRLT